MNNLYEFGGLCDIIIRCASERRIGDKTYAANEPYTILEDVYCSLRYGIMASEANAKNNVIASRVGLPDYVDIRGITLTHKINNLIATQIEKNTISKIYHCAAENGIIWLPESNIVPESIFVYHHNERIVDFTLVGEQIQGALEDGEYLVFYEVLADNMCYDLTTPQYGYFALDIIGKGNTDKSSKNINIKIPAASLMSTPVFEFINGNILYAPLQFKIIHTNQKKPYFNVGD